MALAEYLTCEVQYGLALVAGLRVKHPAPGHHLVGRPAAGGGGGGGGELNNVFI